jgi:predicted TPR repeat methyltransferase
MSQSDERSVADGRLRTAPSSPTEVRALYDEWAEGYEADLDSWDYRTPVDVAELLRDFQPEASHVLDVGCGTGRSGRALEAAGFTSLVGCDLSPKSLDVAEATGVYERLLEVDLQQLPVPFVDDEFDALTCVGVMTYVPDTEAIVREFIRIVRVGGTIVFSQREDVWSERNCSELIGRLARDGLCDPLHQSEPRPYMPNSDEMGDVRVILCALRKR